MADSAIVTGAVAATKNDVLNAATEAKKAEVKAAEDAKAMKPKAGQVLYKAKMPVFNTCTKAGKAIQFMGGQYLTEDKAEIEALDEFVELGMLTKEVGK